MSRKVERYSHPLIADHIASNYVLGTLPRLVIQRVEKLRFDDRYTLLQERIEYWESQLSPLSELTPEVPPSPLTWQAIEQQILPPKDEAFSIWQKLVHKLSTTQVWLQTASLVVFLTLGVFLGLSQQKTDALSYVAILENNNQQPSVVASTYGESQTLVLDIVQLPQLSEESAFELWVTSKTDGQARSLGLIPVGEKSFTRTLTTAEWRLIKDSDTLLITVEESGGSPIGEPMGDEIANGLCIQLTAWQEKV